MEIWHHIVFTKSKHAGFCAYITERGLVKPGSESKGTVQMDISERNPYWIDVQKYILENMFFHFQKQALRRKSCLMPASLEFGAAGAAAIPSRKMGLPIDPLRTRSIIFAKCAAEVCFSRPLFGSRKRPIGETGIS